MSDDRIIDILKPQLVAIIRIMACPAHLSSLFTSRNKQERYEAQRVPGALSDYV